MALFQLAWNATTKVATVQSVGDALPAGSTKLVNSFEHNAVIEGNDTEGSGESHVLYHHVRDALYKIGVKDMARIRINIDTDYIALTSISITPGGTTTLTVAAPTVQLVVVKVPSNASNSVVTWTTSDATKATVSNTGLVTRVANGSAVITATSQDGNRTATKAITTTA